MKSNTTGTAIIVFGILLLGLSFVWPNLAASQSGWTPEKAERKRELVRFQHGGGAQFFPADKETAEREFDQLAAELETAQEGPKTTASIFKWTGIGLVVVGLAVILSQQEKRG